MNDLAARCRVSVDGKHHVAYATADVCYVDDRGVDIDLDAVCELCGANGHAIVSATTWSVMEWEEPEPMNEGAASE